MNNRMSMLLAGCALSLSVFASGARAESLPAAVRSCTAESEPGRRLACFDREVARFPETPPAGTPHESAVSGGAASAGAAGAAGSAAPARAATVDGTAAGAGATGALGAKAAPTSADAGQKAGAVAVQAPPAQAGAEKEPRRLTARIVSIEGSQDEKVLHLDNGQVWQQVQEATAEMNLRAGDSVTLEKGALGGYWLGGRFQGVMKVRKIN